MHPSGADDRQPAATLLLDRTAQTATPSAETPRPDEQEPRARRNPFANLPARVAQVYRERGLLRMDPERHTCTWKNDPVTLTVTEFLILQALATRPGVVKSRNALMDAAYDDQVYVDDRTIDSHIKRLRKKFKIVDNDFEMIETLYGVGYRFKEA